MENSRFLDCLAADYERIRTIVPGHLDAQVPSCPDWTVADLTRHVAQVYLTCAITTDGATWLVATAPGTLTVDGGPGKSPASAAKPDVTITGSPAAVLRWSWNREPPGEPSGVTVQGDSEALAELRRCIVIATQ